MAKQIYKKTVRELFRDMISEMKLKPNEAITREKILNWFIAREISDDLIMATSLVSDVTLLEYQLKATLQQVAAKAQ